MVFISLPPSFHPVTRRIESSGLTEPRRLNPAPGRTREREPSAAGGRLASLVSRFDRYYSGRRRRRPVRSYLGRSPPALTRLLVFIASPSFVCRLTRRMRRVRLARSVFTGRALAAGLGVALRLHLFAPCPYTRRSPRTRLTPTLRSGTRLKTHALPYKPAWLSTDGSRRGRTP